jgi:hypothetical protein
VLATVRAARQFEPHGSLGQLKCRGYQPVARLSGSPPGRPRRRTWLAPISFRPEHCRTLSATTHLNIAATSEEINRPNYDVVHPSAMTEYLADGHAHRGFGHKCRLRHLPRCSNLSERKGTGLPNTNGPHSADPAGRFGSTGARLRRNRRSVLSPAWHSTYQTAVLAAQTRMPLASPHDLGRP